MYTHGFGSLFDKEALLTSITIVLQAAELEKELCLKERETLMVLKELEATKMMVEELKSKLHKPESEAQVKNISVKKPSIVKEDEEEEKENNPNLSVQIQNLAERSNPGLILMELQQAKLNLTRTIPVDLAEVRAIVETYNNKIERERISLEKTRERLRSNTMKISSLEEEMNRTKSELEEGPDILRVMLEIEQIKAAEIRLIAARKMKEAAKAAEAVALAEIKALNEENPESITLTLEEYSSMISKARDPEQSCKPKVLGAMHDEANVSNMDIIRSVEEALEEVRTSKEALEDALNRVEAANRAKLEVEEAILKWRSENGEKRRRSIQNPSKFKNPYPSNRRRDSWVLDVNSVRPILNPTLSIGQILSQKLLITEEFESGKSHVKRKVSLGQMLGKQTPVISSAWKFERGFDGPRKTPVKRKKFGFGRFSVLLMKQSKKKKPVRVTSDR